MDEIGPSPRASRADPQGIAPKPIPVHATPSAALAEMDGRRRELEAWLADARRRAGPAAGASAVGSEPGSGGTAMLPGLPSGVPGGPPAAVPGPA